MRWQAGITTAPRIRETVTASLKSIDRAGWQPRVFADGVCDVPACQRFERTVREPKVGAWSNWLLGLQELYLRDADADAYVMFQDDLLIAQHTREYLETIWKTLPNGMGVLNLFANSRRLRSGAGASLEVVRASPHAISAVALVFTNSSLAKFLGNRYVVNHCRGARGTENIDGAVKRWTRRSGRPEVVHHPSLVQHTGSKIVLDRRRRRRRNSALGHGRKSAILVSRSFVGVDFDARRLLNG